MKEEAVIAFGSNGDACICPSSHLLFDNLPCFVRIVMDRLFLVYPDASTNELTGFSEMSVERIAEMENVMLVVSHGEEDYRVIELDVILD